MILISTENESDLLAIAKDMDLIDDLPHCDLGNVNTLVLIQKSPSEENSWIEGRPVVFDEEQGLAIYRLAPDALTWMCSNAETLADDGVNACALETFAGNHPSNIYAIDTF